MRAHASGEGSVGLVQVTTRGEIHVVDLQLLKCPCVLAQLSYLCAALSVNITTIFAHGIPFENFYGSSAYTIAHVCIL